MEKEVLIGTVEDPYVQLLEECHYKHYITPEAPICKLVLIPCSKAIDVGQCTVLQEYFGRNNSK